MSDDRRPEDRRTGAFLALAGLTAGLFALGLLIEAFHAASRGSVMIRSIAALLIGTGACGAGAAALRSVRRHGAWPFAGRAAAVAIIVGSVAALLALLYLVMAAAGLGRFATGG